MTPQQLQKTTCEEYCFQKFRRGALEHKESWDYETIKPFFHKQQEEEKEV